MVWVAACALLTFIPTASLTVATTIGPILANAAVPKFSATQQRAASAGLWSGSGFRQIHESHPWTQARLSRCWRRRGRPISSTTGLKARRGRWRTGSFPRIRKTSSASCRRNGLRNSIPWPPAVFPERRSPTPRVAQHPGLLEFETLGKAEAIDVMGARFAPALARTRHGAQHSHSPHVWDPGGRLRHGGKIGGPVSRWRLRGGRTDPQVPDLRRDSTGTRPLSSSTRSSDMSWRGAEPMPWWASTKRREGRRRRTPFDGCGNPLKPWGEPRGLSGTMPPPHFSKCRRGFWIATNSEAFAGSISRSCRESARA